MCFTKFLRIFLSVCLIAKGVQCEYTDDPPATNEQLYGPNMCCFFAIGSCVDINVMHEQTPNAKKFAIAHLPKHKLDFAKHRVQRQVYTTAFEDDNWDLYGVTYLIPVEEYNTYVKKDTIYKEKKSPHDTYEEEIRIGRAVKESLVVTLQGKTTNIDCNILLAAGQAATKPPKSVIECYVRIFTAAGLPPDYINKVAHLPTEDC